MGTDLPTPGATRALAEWIAGFRDEAISPRAAEWARHVLLDWIAVTLAGAGEPLVGMLADAYGGGDGLPCTLVGLRARARPHDAALINGSAGHALDFDDVAQRMAGHPSVPVVPAALALAQVRGARGLDLLRAIVVGHEVESRVGEMVSPGHYVHGFHATGTVGTFGAAGACASLAGLDANAVANAIGLAATQAAGLKSMFGTMAKPLHAGKAAMNGLMAAQLAERGFTAHTGALECAQGFALTQSPEIGAFALPIDTRGGFAIESTLFKYHAACYLTHSTIEAVRTLRETHGVGLDALGAMTVRVAGHHRGVCDIETPRTGLNVKFSIRHLAALALDGADTAALDLYSDATALDERVGRARARVELVVEPSGAREDATVTLKTRDGRTLEASANVAIPAADLDAQWRRLVGKARSIAAPVLGDARFERMVSAVRGLADAPDLNPLLETLG